MTKQTTRHTHERTAKKVLFQGVAAAREKAQAEAQTQEQAKPARLGGKRKTSPLPEGDAAGVGSTE